METSPVGAAEALALARRTRRAFVKVGRDTLRFDDRKPLTETEARSYLVHEDGLLRIPVLVWGDLLVRGYTDELYREALTEPGAAGGEP